MFVGTVLDESLITWIGKMRDNRKNTVGLKVSHAKKLPYRHYPEYVVEKRFICQNPSFIIDVFFSLVPTFSPAIIQVPSIFVDIKVISDSPVGNGELFFMCVIFHLNG